MKFLNELVFEILRCGICVGFIPVQQLLKFDFRQLLLESHILYLELLLSQFQLLVGVIKLLLSFEVLQFQVLDL